MSQTIVNILLSAALVITMFGLGLTLTMADLTRVFKAPKAAVIALLCQLFVLPAVAFGLVVSFGLAPELAVGMMLLAASPGGASASLLSHLAGGDVALNIAVTAINSIIALVTFPIVAEVSMVYFLGEGQSIGLQPDKLIQIFVTAPDVTARQGAAAEPWFAVWLAGLSSHHRPRQPRRFLRRHKAPAYPARHLAPAQHLLTTAVDPRGSTVPQRHHHGGQHEKEDTNNSRTSRPDARRLVVRDGRGINSRNPPHAHRPGDPTGHDRAGLLQPGRRHWRYRQLVADLHS